jgi:predicted nucleic acid-binding protein
VRRVVVDASVAVKWLFPDGDAEGDVREALGLLQDLRDGRVAALQPIHWLPEVLAVSARLDPAVAAEATGLLFALEFEVLDEPEVYRTAIELAASLGHHLFDTLYHAVALCADEAELVTADERYYRKAQGRGRMRLLGKL